MRLLQIAALSLAMGVPALAQTAPSPTVGQVIVISNGLTALDGYDTPCKDNNVERICRKPYKFSASALWTIASDAAAARGVVTAYETARNALIRQMANGGTRVPDDSVNKFNDEQQVLLDKPSGLTFGRIKRADLNLDENPIPPNVLALLIPIIDDK